MVYYTHWIVSKEIIFEYVSHNDHSLIYKLYNNEHIDKTFILIYHNEYKFTIVRETDFDMTIFENNPKAYFNDSVSSTNEYNGSECIRLQRSMGCHKYISADNSIEAYKVFNNMNLNVNDLAKRENIGMEQVVYHFAPNLYAVNICTMYDYIKTGENKPYSSYIYIKYNDDTYEIRYELNKGNVYFM